MTNCWKGEPVAVRAEYRWQEIIFFSLSILPPAVSLPFDPWHWLRVNMILNMRNRDQPDDGMSIIWIGNTNTRWWRPQVIWCGTSVALVVTHPVMECKQSLPAGRAGGNDDLQWLQARFLMHMILEIGNTWSWLALCAPLTSLLAQLSPHSLQSVHLNFKLYPSPCCLALRIHFTSHDSNHEL